MAGQSGESPMPPSYHHGRATDPPSLDSDDMSLTLNWLDDTASPIQGDTARNHTNSSQSRQFLTMDAFDCLFGEVPCVNLTDDPSRIDTLDKSAGRQDEQSSLVTDALPMPWELEDFSLPPESSFEQQLPYRSNNLLDQNALADPLQSLAPGLESGVNVDTIESQLSQHLQPYTSGYVQGGSFLDSQVSLTPATKSRDASADMPDGTVPWYKTMQTGRLRKTLKSVCDEVKTSKGVPRLVQTYNSRSHTALGTKETDAHIEVSRYKMVQMFYTLHEHVRNERRRLSGSLDVILTIC